MIRVNMDDEHDTQHEYPQATGWSIEAGFLHVMRGTGKPVATFFPNAWLFVENVDE
jgi:hypothetical protein